MGRFLIGHIFSCNAPLMRPPLQLHASHPLPTMLRYASLYRSMVFTETSSGISTFFLPLRPFFSNQSAHTVSEIRTYFIDMGLPRRYCLSYESCPLPTSYFSALQKRLLSVVFLQVSTMLSGGARKSRDNVSGLSIGLNKGYNELEKYEPGVSTSSIRTTAAGVVDSSSPNSNLVSAMMIPRSAA